MSALPRAAGPSWASAAISPASALPPGKGSSHLHHPCRLLQLSHCQSCTLTMAGGDPVPPAPGGHPGYDTEQYSQAGAPLGQFIPQAVHVCVYMDLKVACE